jgi:hypothetical protein
VVFSEFPLCVEVPGGSPGDTAVINITNTGVSDVGYGALRSTEAPLVPERTPENQFSSVNFAPGETNPNLALVTIGSYGWVCYDANSRTPTADNPEAARADVILDLQATIAADGIDSGEPERIADTRTTRPVAARSPLCIRIPDGSAGDTAVINITNTDVTADGYGALRSSDEPAVPLRRPADQFSSVNFAPGQTNPNLAFVTIGSDGRVCYDSDGGTTNVILDLQATIAADGIDSGEPERIADTRVIPEGTVNVVLDNGDVAFGGRVTARCERTTRNGAILTTLFVEFHALPLANATERPRLTLDGSVIFPLDEPFIATRIFQLASPPLDRTGSVVVAIEDAGNRDRVLVARFRVSSGASVGGVASMYVPPVRCPLR